MSFKNWPSIKNVFGIGGKPLHVFLASVFIISALIIGSIYSGMQLFEDLNNFTISRNKTLSFLVANILKERLDGIVDVGTSISSENRLNNLVKEGKWDEAVEELQKVPLKLTYIKGISLFDSSGIFRGALNPTPEQITLIGSDFSYRDYYQGVMKTKEPYIAQAIKPVVDLGYNLVPVAIPIKSDSEDIVGILLLQISLDNFYEWVKTIDAGPESLIYIVDQKGSLVSHPQFLSSEDVVDFSKVSAVDRVIKGESGVDVSLNISTNEEYFDAYEPVPNYGWGVVFSQPTRIAFAERDQITTRISLVRALGILLIGFFMYRLWRDRKLINEQLGKENLLVKDMMRRTFELEDIKINLEKTIKTRTGELSDKVAELEKSKLAILNLLEDVEDEKAKVEAIVLIRTKELSDEKARLLASINSLSMGFVIADVNNRIIMRNPAILSILEILEEPETIEDIAKYFSNFNLLSQCAQCIALKAPVEIKSIEYRKKYIRVFCVPILEHGVSIGFVFLVEDITEAKVLERSRDEFFAVASHELRTPLTAIRGNSEMILDMFAEKIKDKDMKEMLVDINTSSLRLIDIVNDFLEVSRLEQGRFKVQKENFNLSDAIENTIRNLTLEAKKKGLKLEYDRKEENLPNVFSDKMRVEQVLVNLVGNAIKFTNEGIITVHVEPIENFLKIQVVDTGIGVSDQNKNLLFRKFQQAGEKMLARDVTQGTGLGLYISQLIVAALGGTIGLEKSKFGKGSTFTFTLPLAS